MIDLETYEIQGDKKHSSFFYEYLPRIYARRQEGGLDENIGHMQGIVVQVETGEGVNYIAELHLMTSYAFVSAYVCKTHKVFVLRNGDNMPVLFVIEPLNSDYSDKFTAINEAFVRGREKPNARYLGEIFFVKDKQAVHDTLHSHAIRFLQEDRIQNAFLAHEFCLFTDPSYYTNNIVGYTDVSFDDIDRLELGEKLSLTDAEMDRIKQAKDIYHGYGFAGLLLGIDHLATRIFSDEREDAILEFLTMSNYYFWGAYTIEDMNSSTNICRSLSSDDELRSPAKVFTANNTPFYVQTFDDKPSPTEDFVRNFGKRMHHVAHAVLDGEQANGVKNVDYVTGKLQEAHVRFLHHIVGECKDAIPDLKQIFSHSSQYSRLITEYVQRCQDFAGFFTKENVATLTKAAGDDEKLKNHAVCD